MLNKKNYTLKYYEIKDLYEVFRDCLTKTGFSNEAAQFISKNLKIFEKPYYTIVPNIVTKESIERNTDFNNYRREEQALVMKYADRDSYGNIIFEADNKTPKISEMIVEFKKELEELQTKYSGILEIVANPQAYNTNYLNQEMDVECFVWDNVTDIPDNIPPIFYVYFYKEEN